MTNEKKSREIHVDQLVIHAKEVRLVDAEGREWNRPRSPFGMFPLPPVEEEVVAREEQQQAEGKEDNDERPRHPFSWI